MYFPTSDASKLQINTLIYHPTVANAYFLEVAQLTPSLAQLVLIVKFMSNTLKVLKISSHIGTQAELTLHGNPAVPSGTQFNIGAASSSDSNLIPDNIPLISIRLAPSVDSSITGALGEREIINRMSLALDSVGILTTHESEISLILNPQLFNR